MKTRFTLAEDNNYIDVNIWEHDEDQGEFFIMIDKKINLNVGDRVYVDGFKLVNWKCVYALKGFIEYSLEDE